LESRDVVGKGWQVRVTNSPRTTRRCTAGSPQKAVAAVVGLGDQDGPDSDIGRQLRYSLHLSKVYRSYNCFFDEPGESAVK
jgi:hypothetical protein